MRHDLYFIFLTYWIERFFICYFIFFVLNSIFSSVTLCHGASVEWIVDWVALQILLKEFDALAKSHVSVKELMLIYRFLLISTTHLKNLDCNWHRHQPSQILSRKGRFIYINGFYKKTKRVDDCRVCPFQIDCDSSKCYEYHQPISSPKISSSISYKDFA